MLFKHSNKGKYNIILESRSKKRLGVSSAICIKFRQVVWKFKVIFSLTNLYLIKSSPVFLLHLQRKLLRESVMLAFVISLLGSSDLPEEIELADFSKLI